MGLPRRLGAVVALMSVLLVLAGAKVALDWSQRSRLEDLRTESVTLAQTLATFLTDLAPTGDPQDLVQGFGGWSRQHVTRTRAQVYLRDTTALTAAVTSDTVEPDRPVKLDYDALEGDSTTTMFVAGTDPGWRVAAPLGGERPYGVLDIKVSTLRLESWARRERWRVYTLAGTSAALVGLGVALLTAGWIGRPLSELGRAMAGAHAGAGGAPAAPELGPPEFRALAREYNHMREALARREAESRARAALLTLEERARSFDRLALMEETTSSFAHEIGTPLNTLSGHLQLLLDDLRESGDQVAVDRASLLLGQVDRMATIVRARLDRGEWPHPILRPSDLREIAGHMLQFLEPSFQEAGVEATLLPAAGNVPARALCDTFMVEQILLNLLKNAIEALSHGGHVVVRTAVDTGTVALDVQDDGPGLAAAARHQLFNPFATTKGTAGTGLGLAVSRRLARAMGGDLQHVPLERGTGWRLTLPRAPV